MYLFVNLPIPKHLAGFFFLRGNNLVTGGRYTGGKSNLKRILEEVPVEKLNLLVVKLLGSPRLIWVILLLTLIALALAAGAPDDISCGSSVC